MRTFVRLVGVLVVLPHANFQMYVSRVHNDEVASTVSARADIAQTMLRARTSCGGCTHGLRLSTIFAADAVTTELRSTVVMLSVPTGLTLSPSNVDEVGWTYTGAPKLLYAPCDLDSPVYIPM